MPAKVYHVYNKGIEAKTLYGDEADYQVFLDYLKGYLSAPLDPVNTKQEFVVNGKTFKGVPHQPKNYSGKMELLAYSLRPNHFHLILREIASGSLQSFIRSLCTRYSIYFNKKYKRSGALFRGPYKSIQIEKDTDLNLLTSFLHHQSGKYSSYEEYAGSRETSWIKNTTINAKSFKADDKEMELLKKISFETSEEHLVRTVLSSPVAITAEIKEKVKNKKSLPLFHQAPRLQLALLLPRLLVLQYLPALLLQRLLQFHHLLLHRLRYLHLFHHLNHRRVLYHQAFHRVHHHQ